jgi:hypothetical protein
MWASLAAAICLASAAWSLFALLGGGYETARRKEFLEGVVFAIFCFVVGVAIIAWQVMEALQ